MNLHELAKFEVALEDLAKAHGLELVHSPNFSYGPCGITSMPGSALWTVYDANGSPSTSFAVNFRPKGMTE